MDNIFAMVYDAQKPADRNTAVTITDNLTAGFMQELHHYYHF